MDGPLAAANPILAIEPEWSADLLGTVRETRRGTGRFMREGGRDEAAPILVRREKAASGGDHVR